MAAAGVAVTQGHGQDCESRSVCVFYEGVNSIITRRSGVTGDRGGQGALTSELL